MSRTDDIINVAGHRLSTGGMEEVLAGHPDVAECAVIGVNDSLKGQVPLGFVVLKSGTTLAGTEIMAEIIQRVRSEIGPVAAFKKVVIVGRLPKTRSEKSCAQQCKRSSKMNITRCQQQSMILLFWKRLIMRCNRQVLNKCEVKYEDKAFLLIFVCESCFMVVRLNQQLVQHLVFTPPAFSIAAFKSCCLHKPSMAGCLA